MDDNIPERVARVEESAKSAHKRIDHMETIQDQIQMLAISVNELAGSIKRICNDVTDVKNRVSNIESKPGKRWDLLINTALSIAIGAIMGYMITHLLV